MSLIQIVKVFLKLKMQGFINKRFDKMNVHLSIPQFLVEAINDMKEAFNLYYHSSDVPNRHRIPKFKENEYSFSAVVCHLITKGIEKEFEITQKATSEGWRMPERFDNFKQLIEAAFQKSQNFNIDNPKRIKEV
jgi:hypothetical protein